MKCDNYIDELEIEANSSELIIDAKTLKQYFCIKKG